MKHAALFKTFLRYASLSVAGMLGMSCYILADTFFVSLGLGKNGLAALNFAIPVYSVIHGAGLMIGVGGATKYALLCAAGERRRAQEVFTNALYLAAAFAVPFVLAGALFSGQIASLLGADAATFAMTRTYLQTLLLFSPAFLLNNVLAAFVRNDGSPRLAMFSTVGGSLSNILLDYVFIFPCGMGMFGAVFATCLAPVIGIGVSCLHFIGGRCGFRIVKTPPRGGQIAACFSLGFFSFAEQLSNAAVILCFNVIVYGIAGNTGVAAYGVVANVALVAVSVFTGVAQGMQPPMSRAQGEGRQGDVRRLFAYAAATAAGIGLAIWLTVFFAAEPIAQIFNSEQDAALPAVAAKGLRLYFIGMLPAGFNMVACACFASTARPLPSQGLTLLRGLAAVIPLAFAFAALWGITGLWLAFPAAEGITAICGILCLRFYKGKGGRGKGGRGRKEPHGMEEEPNGGEEEPYSKGASA